METIRLLASPLLPPEELERALQILHAKGLVAIPTETVYGLAADLFEEEAIREIFRVKGRPSDNPLIAHIASFAQIDRLISAASPLFLKLAEHFWPGPLTLVAKRRPEIPSIAAGHLPSIAVRMPSHPAALQLIEAFGSPLAAPSANLSGRPSPTSFEDVFEDFAGKIPLVIDGGRCAFGIESTVISLLEERPILLRPGAISREAIEAALGVRLSDPQKGGPILSPGMKYRHYAPKAKIHLVKTAEELAQHLASKKTYAPHVTAQNLYAHLRQADRLGYGEIAILIDERIGGDEALMNRLNKASG